MRVSVVTESFHPAGRGWTTQEDRATTYLVDRLVDTGHEVAIVAPGPGMTSYRRAAVRRVDLYDRPGRQVRAALDQHSPDVVHVVDPGRLGRKALGHTAAEGVVSVVTQREPVPGPAWDRWRARVADRAGDLLVTSTWMHEALGAEGVAARLWLPGVDTDAFNPALRDQWLHDRWARAACTQGPQVVVGYVGDLRRSQGVRRLATLAAIPGIRVVIVGAGAQRAWLAKHLPGAKLVEPPSTGELATALASLDVLVHPSEQLTCAHVLRQAAASGVPVVAARQGGALDVVRPLETGLLFDPADPHAMARAVAAVAADPHRGLLGARGRELALGRSWTQAIDELLDQNRQAGRAVA